MLQHSLGLFWITSTVIATVQAKKGDTEVLNEEPLLLSVRNVITKPEAAALLALAQEIGMEQTQAGPQNRSNGGEESAVLDEVVAREEGWVTISQIVDEGWAATKTLQQTAETMAGLPVRTAPAPVVTMWEKWVPGSLLNRSGMLHLDARRHRWRHKTLLVYLSGEGNWQTDGSTVFPCLETDDMSPKEATRRSKLCSRAARHLQHAHEKLMRTREEGLSVPPEKQYAFMEAHPELLALPQEDEQGGRPVDWRWTPEHDAATLAGPDSIRVDPLHALAERMCRGKAPGLRVPSRLGSGLLIEAAPLPRVGPKGMTYLQPHWSLWHAGCSPTKGKRWTAQVFLEAFPEGGSGSEKCSQGLPTEQCAKHASRSS